MILRSDIIIQPDGISKRIFGNSYQQFPQVTLIWVQSDILEPMTDTLK